MIHCICRVSFIDRDQKGGGAEGNITLKMSQRTPLPVHLSRPPNSANTQSPLFAKLEFALQAGAEPSESEIPVDAASGEPRPLSVLRGELEYGESQQVLRRAHLDGSPFLV